MSADLVVTNLGLAYSIADRFSARSMGADDLRQEAALALCKAAERFDPARGVAFSTYATSVIKGHLRNVLSRSDAKAPEPVADGEPMEVTQDDVEAVVWEARASIAKALGILDNDTTRSVLRLAMLDGKPRAAVCDELGITPATYRWHLDKGLRVAKSL